MKLGFDIEGRLVIEPTGKDTPVTLGVPQGLIIVLADASVVQVWEKDARIHQRTTRASDLSKLSRR